VTANSRGPGSLSRWVLPARPRRPVNPVLLRHAEQRAGSAQNRVADAITAFAGSMAFVYLHVLWFGCWFVFRIEHYPYGLLTMIVSLEAIFLSTFVLISQNRADARRQVVADQQWETVREEERQNTRLIALSEQILALTKEVRDFAGLAQEDHARDQHLLDVSRRTLALTEDLHEATARRGSGAPSPRSTGSRPD
jgi:uncharacterized membrane protein